MGEDPASNENKHENLTPQTRSEMRELRIESGGAGLSLGHRAALSKHVAVVLEHHDNGSEHQDDGSLQPARRKKHVAVVSEQQDVVSKSRDVASLQQASVSACAAVVLLLRDALSKLRDDVSLHRATRLEAPTRRLVLPSVSERGRPRKSERAEELAVVERAVNDHADGKRVGPGVGSSEPIVATAGDVRNASHVPALVIQFPAVAVAAWTRFDSFSVRWQRAVGCSSSARLMTEGRFTARPADRSRGERSGGARGAGTGAA